MKFSLILATLNRTTELERFLVSLSTQTYKDFELIIVDQNDDDRLVPVLNKYEKFYEILHLRSRKGLSRARNKGIEYATGDILCFPDDDCWYHRDLLQNVYSVFSKNLSYVGVTGTSIDNTGKASVTNWDATNGLVTKLNVWKRCTSISIFLKMAVFKKHGLRFDETLGVGADTPWGAGEDDDIILSALQYGIVYYINSIKVGHNQIEKNYLNIKKALSYARGMGKVLRKHNYPYWFVGYSLLRPIGGMIISLLFGRWNKARFHKALFIGRYQGWQSKL